MTATLFLSLGFCVAADIAAFLVGSLYESGANVL